MGNAQVIMTMLQARFMCESVEAVERGAKVYWLQDAEERLEDFPNCAVLFPDGCVDFLVIRPGVKPDDVERATGAKPHATSKRNEHELRH